MNVRTAALNPGTSNSPASVTNFIRLSDARLHAVSSRNMYSEQGLLALMRPLAGHVCHSLIVVSNCRPGAAHERPVAIFLDRVQEVVVDADRVVAVLPGDRAVGRRVPAGVVGLELDA